MVSVFLTDVRLSIGQYKIDDKTNEIKGIPELLIEIKDATIAIDAIGIQKKIVEKIRIKGGHYCLSIKNNQKLLLEDIDTYFKYSLRDKVELAKIKTYSTAVKDHSRIDKRKYYIVNDVSFINSKESG